MIDVHNALLQINSNLDYSRHITYNALQGAHIFFFQCRILVPPLLNAKSRSALGTLDFHRFQPTLCLLFGRRPPILLHLGPELFSIQRFGQRIRRDAVRVVIDVHGPRRDVDGDLGNAVPPQRLQDGLDDGDLGGAADSLDVERRSADARGVGALHEVEGAVPADGGDVSHLPQAGGQLVHPDDEGVVVDADGGG